MAKEFTKKLILEDGRVFYGYAFGANRDAVCEIVFQTSMVGYHEVVTDPSYTGQAVVMTYPVIGNYGITEEESGTRQLTIGGMIVRDYNDSPSNFRYTKTLSEILEENNVPAISGVDTRMLTRIIRDEGSQKVLLTSPDTTTEEGVRRLRETALPAGQVERVSTRKKWYSRTANHLYNVVVVDCGVKINMVKKLNEAGCNVTVVPYDTTADQILGLKPDGLFLSNGPGDPVNVTPVIELIKELRGKLPICGICLGHQLICLAYGAKTHRMKRGHRGGNHPVKNLATGKIEITNQNHGFVVDADSLKGTGLCITHMNLLDNTVEGVADAPNRLFSIQYYPDDPNSLQDEDNLFNRFVNSMKEVQRNG